MMLAFKVYEGGAKLQPICPYLNVLEDLDLSTCIWKQDTTILICYPFVILVIVMGSFLHLHDFCLWGIKGDYFCD